MVACLWLNVAPADLKVISVPSMVTDLTTSNLIGYPLEVLLFGGAPAPDTLVQRAREAFPTSVL